MVVINLVLLYVPGHLTWSLDMQQSVVLGNSMIVVWWALIRVHCYLEDCSIVSVARKEENEI